MSLGFTCQWYYGPFEHRVKKFTLPVCVRKCAHPGVTGWQRVASCSCKLCPCTARCVLQQALGQKRQPSRAVYCCQWNQEASCVFFCEGLMFTHLLVTGTADWTWPQTKVTKYLKATQLFLERLRNGKAASDSLEKQLGNMHLNTVHLEKGTAVFLVWTGIGQMHSRWMGEDKGFKHASVWQLTLCSSRVQIEKELLPNKNEQIYNSSRDKEFLEAVLLARRGERVAFGQPPQPTETSGSALASRGADTDGPALFLPSSEQQREARL